MQNLSNKNVLAIVAHPDDIEFIMAGTLLLLRDLGWRIHYMTLANGCCGSMTEDRDATAKRRLAETQAAASLLDATFYPPICDDMNVFYNEANLKKVCSVVRTSNPSIVLTHSPIDYMEDHEQTCRLAVGATFCKGMPNYRCDPEKQTSDSAVAIYHAQPHGNRKPLGELVRPGYFVDIESVLDRKTAMLRCHQSQESWLDSTQRMSSYVNTMIEQGRELGKMSKTFCFAEGFRKRYHLGYADADFDPLTSSLGDNISRTNDLIV